MPSLSPSPQFVLWGNDFKVIWLAANFNETDISVDIMRTCCKFNLCRTYREQTWGKEMLPVLKKQIQYIFAAGLHNNFTLPCHQYLTLKGFVRRNLWLRLLMSHNLLQCLHTTSRHELVHFPTFNNMYKSSRKSTWMIVSLSPVAAKRFHACQCYWTRTTDLKLLFFNMRDNIF